MKYTKTPTRGPEKKKKKKRKHEQCLLFFLPLYPFAVIINDYESCNAREGHFNSFLLSNFEVLTSDHCISVFHLFQVSLEPASSILLA